MKASNTRPSQDDMARRVASRSDMSSIPGRGESGQEQTVDMDSDADSEQVEMQIDHRGQGQRDSRRPPDPRLARAGARQAADPRRVVRADPRKRTADPRLADPRRVAPRRTAESAPSEAAVLEGTAEEAVNESAPEAVVASPVERPPALDSALAEAYNQIKSRHAAEHIHIEPLDDVPAHLEEYAKSMLKKELELKMRIKAGKKLKEWLEAQSARLESLPPVRERGAEAEREVEEELSISRAIRSEAGLLCQRVRPGLPALAKPPHASVYGHIPVLCFDTGEALNPVNFRNMLQDQVDHSQCIVCWETIRDTLLLPCRHLAHCKACSNRISVCSVCETPIQGRVVIEGRTTGPLQRITRWLKNTEGCKAANVATTVVEHRASCHQGVQKPRASKNTGAVQWGDPMVDTLFIQTT